MTIQTFIKIVIRFDEIEASDLFSDYIHNNCLKISSRWIPYELIEQNRKDRVQANV